MPVVDVRHVGVIVHELSMKVLVTVWLARRVAGAMSVLMVLVVYVEVRVRQLFMPVQMRMAFAQEGGDAERHQQHGSEVERPQRLAQHDDGRDGADERRGRKAGGFPRGA